MPPLDDVPQTLTEALSSGDLFEESALDNLIGTRYPYLSWSDYSCGNMRDFVSLHLQNVAQNRSPRDGGMAFRLVIASSGSPPPAKGAETREPIEYRFDREMMRAIVSPRGPRVYANGRTGEV